MKNKRILKLILWIVLTLISIVSLALLSYSVYLYKGIETFYRIYAIIIFIYLIVLNSYYLLSSARNNRKKSFIVWLVLSIILNVIMLFGYYYLHNIYKAVNAYSDNENMYYTSLVTYNKDLKSYKDLKEKTIGLISDDSDIEGNVLPLDVIDELKLKDKNEIKYFDSTIELLTSLKNKEIDAAFFSSNYIDMFETLDGYEKISEETNELYKKSKEYKIEVEEKTASSLTEPFTMLLIGVDSSNDGVTSGYNADVLLLVSFNPKTLRATITSVPRDMYLKTACSNGVNRRINTTTWGSSSSCAVETVSNIFDVDINYYAKINFKGIVELVDSLGGIDINVDYSICDQNSSRDWDDNTVYVEKGYQHLNGEQALAIARNRHKPGDGSDVGDLMNVFCPSYTEGERNDYTRGKNQMKVILGIVNAATKLKDPNQALDILTKIERNFQTNVKSEDVFSLYNLGKSIIINNNSNLVNVQRTQLNGQNVWGSVYEPSSQSYPAVTIPYTGSINDIKDVINTNLGKKEIEIIKTISFDLNNPFKDEVIGNGSYSRMSINTLKDVSGYGVNDLKDYASNNGLSLTFIDVDTNENIELSDYSKYNFYSQVEHKDTLINQLSTLTIYVKKKETKPIEIDDQLSKVN